MPVLGATLPTEHDRFAVEGHRPTSQPTFFIRRVRVIGYKSIGVCDVLLEPLTVFVGRNGAGKSNFLDALSFLRDVVVLGVSESIDRHVGRDAVANRGMDDGIILPTINCVISGPADDSHEYEYTLKLCNVKRRKRPGISEEKLTVTDADSKTVYEFVSTPEELVINDSQSAHLQITVSEVPGQFPATVVDAAIVSDLRLGKYARQFHSAFVDSGFYSFNPESIRKPQKLKYGSTLKRDGSNLADVALVTKDESPEQWSRTVGYLQNIVPQIEDVTDRQVAKPVRPAGPP